MDAHTPNLPPAFETEAQATRHASADIAHVQPEQTGSSERLASSQTLGEYGARAATSLCLDYAPAPALPEPNVARAQEQKADPFSELIAVRAELQALEAATRVAIAKERVIACDLLAAGHTAEQLAAVNPPLANDGQRAQNQAAAPAPKQYTRQRSLQTTEPIDLMEPASYIPQLNEQVYDHRPDFLGRVGTVTGFYPDEQNPIMLYVRPNDFDGEHQAEWNARPCDVSPKPPQFT